MPSHKFTARPMPPLPSSGQVDYWDDSLPNFGMRVSAGGTRTWIVMYRYNGTKRRMKIGNYPTKSLADARDEAREALRKAEKGFDPATERRKQTARAETVAELADLYIEQHAKRKKRSWLKDRQILDREVIPHIGRKRVVDVSKTDIRGVLQPIIDRDAPIRANHTLEVVRKMFNWAIDERDMPMINPAARIGTTSRYGSRSAWEALLGPSAGLASNLSQVLGNVGKGDWRASDTHAMRRMLPYQNLFYLRRVFDAAEEGINDAFGVPPAPKRAGSR